MWRKDTTPPGALASAEPGMRMCSSAVYNTTVSVCAAPIQESQAVYHITLAVSASPKHTRASSMV
jgi:hypothetical protein